MIVWRLCSVCINQRQYYSITLHTFCYRHYKKYENVYTKSVCACAVFDSVKCSDMYNCLMIALITKHYVKHYDICLESVGQ